MYQHFHSILFVLKIEVKWFVYIEFNKKIYAIQLSNEKNDQLVNSAIYLKQINEIIQKKLQVNQFYLCCFTISATDCSEDKIRVKICDLFSSVYWNLFFFLSQSKNKVCMFFRGNSILIKTRIYCWNELKLIKDILKLFWEKFHFEIEFVNWWTVLTSIVDHWKVNKLVNLIYEIFRFVHFFLLDRNKTYLASFCCC